jgi:hypothetical protein
MLRYAETLADGFDFIRVDLYDTADRVCFGELTVTPGGGASVLSPLEFDRDLGAMWHPSRAAPAGVRGNGKRVKRDGRAHGESERGDVNI